MTGLWERIYQPAPWRMAHPFQVLGEHVVLNIQWRGIMQKIDDGKGIKIIDDMKAVGPCRCREKGVPTCAEKEGSVQDEMKQEAAPEKS